MSFCNRIRVIRLVAYGALIVSATLASFFVYRTHFRSAHLRHVLLNSDRWASRIRQFENASGDESATVLLGDSLTRSFPTDLLSRPPYLNWGVGGDFAASLLLRLEPLEVVKPRIVLLMIGINDIIANESMPTIQDNYRTIVRSIRRHCPDSKLYVQSCLPTAFHSGMLADNSQTNQRVIELNLFLTSLCVEFEADYVDLYPVFERHGQMRADTTNDGIHLNTFGYELWADQVRRQWNTELGTIGAQRPETTGSWSSK